MIPKSSIYSSFREDLLDFYPSGVRTKVKSIQNCYSWMSENGCNIVDASSPGIIIIEAHKISFASMWLNEVENLINHCLEHLRELLINTATRDKRSDAWQVVTVYYYGFFAAECLLRLLGRPITYFDDSMVLLLKSIAPVANKITGGSYLIEKTKDISITTGEYRLKRQNKRNHEAVWLQLFDIISKKIALASPKTASTEIDLYTMFSSPIMKNLYKRVEWPSIVRSNANYKPGFAYRSVFQESTAKTYGLIEQWRNLSSENVQTQFNNSISSCSASDLTEFDKHVKYLHDISHLIFIMARELYGELKDRRSSIDKRWELSRSEFCKSIGTKRNDYALLLHTYN